MSFSGVRAAVAPKARKSVKESSFDKLKKLSREKLWVYRVVIAGQCEGEQLEEMIQTEREPGVLRQLAWNMNSSSEQLEHIYNTIADLCAKGVIRSYWQSEIAYALNKHDNATPLQRARYLLGKQ